MEDTVSTSSGQGHPRLGLVERLDTPPPQGGSHRGRENFSRSGGQVLGEAGRKRKRGDQAKLAPRRGFHPLPHRPPRKHKQLEALRVSRELHGP